MITDLLKSALDPVAERHRSVRRFWGLAVCWALSALAAVVIVIAQWESPFAMLGLVATSAVLAWMTCRRAAA